MSQLVAAQEWFERVHQEHLNANKFSEYVHLHRTAPLAASLGKKGLSNPFTDTLPLSCCERSEFTEFGIGQLSYWPFWCASLLLSRPRVSKFALAP